MTSTAPPPSDAALQAGEAPTPIVVPWTPRDVFVGFIIWAGSVVALFGVGLFVPARLADPATLAIFAVGEAALLIPVFFLAIRKHKARGQDLGLRGFAWKLPAIGCAGMLIIYGCNYFYALILSAFSLRVQPSLTPLMTGTAHPIVLLVLGVFLAPPAEEVFFRGFVFAGLGAPDQLLPIHRNLVVGWYFEADWTYRFAVRGCPFQECGLGRDIQCLQTRQEGLG